MALLDATAEPQIVCRFEVPGPPQGKGRPRFRVVKTRAGAEFVSVYTPAETRKYETQIAWHAKVAMRGQHPVDCGVSLDVVAYMPVPTSWSEKKRDAALAGIVRPLVKPDFDNVLKVVDALKDVVWVDDTLVAEASVRKFYDERPRLEILVKRL